MGKLEWPFGLGINKPDVRFVYNQKSGLSPSQEYACMVARDGKQAHACLAIHFVLWPDNIVPHADINNLVHQFSFWLCHFRMHACTFSSNMQKKASA